MALQGHTKAYSLEDIFQFISANKYSGTLLFNTKEREYMIYFSRGNLFIPLEKTTFRDPHRLEKLGLVDSETMVYVKYLEERSKTPALGILLYTSLVDPLVAQKTLAPYMEEDLYYLFGLEGDYIFHKDKFVQYLENPEDQKFSLPTGNVVMEACRRIDEMNRIRQDLPNDVYLFTGENPGPEREGEIAQYLKGALDLDTLAQKHYLDPFNLYSAVQKLKEKNLVRVIDEEEYLQQIQKLLEKGSYGEALYLYFQSLKRKDFSEAIEKIASSIFGDEDIKSLLMGSLFEEENKFLIKTDGPSFFQFLQHILQYRFPLSLRVYHFAPEKSEYFFDFDEPALTFGKIGGNNTEDTLTLLGTRGLLSAEDLEKWWAAKIQPATLGDELVKAGILPERGISSFMEERFMDLISLLYHRKGLHVEFYPRDWSADSEIFLAVKYQTPKSIHSLSGKFYMLFELLKKSPQRDVVLILNNSAQSHPSPDEQFREFILDLRKAPRPLKVMLDTLSPRYDIRQILEYTLANIDSGSLRKPTLQETCEELEAYSQIKALDKVKMFLESAESMGYTDGDEYCRKMKKEYDLLSNFANPDAPGVSGELASFSLAEILQTLVTSQLSGTLTIEAEEGETGTRKTRDLYFYDGKVYLLREEVREAKQELRSLFLETQAVMAIGETFGDDLVESGLVTEGEIDDELAFQVKEDIYEIFFWEDATFCFRRDALPGDFITPPTSMMKLQLKTDEFLMAAIARIERWHEMLGAIPTEKTIFYFLTPESKQQALGSDLPPQVLYLIDGTHNVDNIIRISGQRKFEIYQILSELLEYQYIALLPPTRVAELAKDAKERGDHKRARDYFAYLAKKFPEDPQLEKIEKSLFGEDG